MNAAESIGVSTSGSTGDHKPVASHFSQLPGSTLGWTAVGLIAAYVVLVTLMARVPLGLPTWLDFTLGLAPGVAGTVVLGFALFRERERSWLVWLAVVGLVYAFGGWLLFAAMALGV